MLNLLNEEEVLEAWGPEYTGREQLRISCRVSQSVMILSANTLKSLT